MPTRPPYATLLRDLSPKANPMTEQVIIGLSTCPDDVTARHLAHTLVTERLATCVNRLSGVTSTYFWDGRLQDDAEILLIIKTTAARQAELEARLKALHPYQVPEVLFLPVTGGNAAYLEWVRSGVGKV